MVAILILEGESEEDDVVISGVPGATLVFSPTDVEPSCGNPTSSMAPFTPVAVTADGDTSTWTGAGCNT